MTQVLGMGGGFFRVTGSKEKSFNTEDTEIGRREHGEIVAFATVA